MASLRTGQNLLRRANSGVTRITTLQTSTSSPQAALWQAYAQHASSTAAAAPSPSTIHRRPFSGTSLAAAKKNKSKLHSGGTVDPAHRDDAVSAVRSDPKAKAKGGAAAAAAATADYNFDALEEAWGRTDRFHADKLKQLRAGGRFNPDVIGKLPVRMAHHHHDDQPVASPHKGGGGKKDAAAAAPPAGGTVVPLDQLAMVVPQGGRTIEIRLHEASSKKSVMSAVQASPDFNQQPQADPDNELVLLLRIQPEPADAQVKRVKEVCREWREQVRLAGQKRHKMHQAWKKDKSATPDDVHRLDKELQKLQDKKMEAIDRTEKEALKQVSNSQRSF
ncbi:uncharacterized protein E0L32_011970 [Thyridium curvatum]|uniref:Ribosome recycling factor domain-containing protein n=1 Tax=Thyridium curvatum TaxID=1093900 RepID=A0A507BKI5_9PEZI|nr:uncharacterized protein E0L32_011970 [Thyridium curvatum]TPX17969.1 hypothetical protein E0L32_011970 [Thyridium curvatum]